MAGKPFGLTALTATGATGGAAAAAWLKHLCTTTSGEELREVNAGTLEIKVSQCAELLLQKREAARCSLAESLIESLQIGYASTATESQQVRNSAKIYHKLLNQLTLWIRLACTQRALIVAASLRLIDAIVLLLQPLAAPL